MRTFKLLSLAIFIIGPLILAGCSDNPVASKSVGQLRLYLIDQPAQYDQVNIAVTKVEVHAADSDSLGGWITINSTPATYDLLTLRNGANAILGQNTLPVGTYTQIRLGIGSGSNVVVNNITYDLDISSATGIKLNRSFQIQSGALYELTLDFDADKSIVLTGNNQYKLQPVIRVIANVTSGSISGIVNPALPQNIISTIAGADTLTTMNDSTGFFKFLALPAGAYNLTIVPSDTTAYFDTTIMGIDVIAQQNTNIGTIVLRPR